MQRIKADLFCHCIWDFNSEFFFDCHDKLYCGHRIKVFHPQVFIEPVGWIHSGNIRPNMVSENRPEPSGNFSPVWWKIMPAKFFFV